MKNINLAENSERTLKNFSIFFFFAFIADHVFTNNPIHQIIAEVRALFFAIIQMCPVIN